MAKYNLWLRYLIILGVVLVLLLIASIKNRRYESQEQPILRFKQDLVNAVSIINAEQSLTLVKGDSGWTFITPDTIRIKDYKINNLFKTLFNGRRTGYVTSNPDKYAMYKVTPEEATIVELRQNERVLGILLIGSSQPDYERGYLRDQDYLKYPDDPKVYMSRDKMLYHISADSAFWR